MSTLVYRSIRSKRYDRYMKCAVTVKPNSKTEKVEKAEDGTLVVWVHDPPTQGKANEAVIRLLSNYYSVPKSHIRLVLGKKGKRKLFEIIQDTREKS